MSTKFTGNAWVFGDDIDTDTILPSQYMRLQPEEYAKHALEPLDPDFTEKISDGDILVARKNFGIGSSREQAVVALQRSGIDVVIAESFARVFYRNAINAGLPAIRCPLDDIDQITEGDKISVDLIEGVVQNQTSNEVYEFEPFEEPIKSIIESGGATEYYG